MKTNNSTRGFILAGILIVCAIVVSVSMMPATAQADYYYGNHNYNNHPVMPPAAIYGYNPAPTYPTYTPYPTYTYNYPTYSSLYVSCTPNTTSVRTGNSATWSAYASGGTGSYSYYWSGTDGLSGYGSSFARAYYSVGSKYATVTVTSGNQAVTQSCGNAVNVVQDHYDYPTYNYPYHSGPLAVSCAPSYAYINNGGAVTWNAYASGGAGSYSYSWSGTDGLYGSGNSVYYNYQTPGSKYATVTVYSAGQTVTQSCSALNVNTPASYNVANVYTAYTNYANTSSSLDVASYSDPSTIRANQPTTWTAEASGGVAPYKYSWTGSDGLNGTQATVIKYYATSGEKNAIATVTSADGRTGTKACSNNVVVRAAASTNVSYTAPAPKYVQPTPTVNPTPQVQSVPDQDGISAAALFSLKNVPWGWVAVLTILVLFLTVMYLLFNRTKI